jgi:hypothetical protein
MSLQHSSPERLKMTVICPECETEMTISAVTPTMFGNMSEDTVYRCKKCGVLQPLAVDNRRSAYGGFIRCPLGNTGGCRGSGVSRPT